MDGRTLRRFSGKSSIDSNGCWIWQAHVNAGGYAMFWNGERMQSAHRTVYEHYVGAIPEGLQLDHLCRVRHCVNAAHLEPVPPAENTRRGVSANRLKTHCPEGHAYDDENTYFFPTGGRGCRTCRNASSLRWYHRNRAGV